MIKRCPDHRYIGNGILQGYRWIISERGYANIIKSESDEVHGVVYEISDTDEQRLDRYEGVGKGRYEKEMMAVEIDGKTCICLVYVDPVMEDAVSRWHMK